MTKKKQKQHVVDPVWLIRWYAYGEAYIAIRPEVTPPECSKRFEEMWLEFPLVERGDKTDARMGWDNGIYNWRVRNDRPA